MVNEFRIALSIFLAPLHLTDNWLCVLLLPSAVSCQRTRVGSKLAPRRFCRFPELIDAAVFNVFVQLLRAEINVPSPTHQSGGY